MADDATARNDLFRLVIGGAAVVIVRHLNKAVGGKALYRGLGSIGIIGLARSGLLVAKDPDNSDRRILASTKCNLAKLPAALVYALDTASNRALRIRWVEESPHTAETLLAAPRDNEVRNAVQDAADFLRDLLAKGPRPAKDVENEASSAGISEKTLHRAKSMLRIKSQKAGFGKNARWKWGLPS